MDFEDAGHGNKTIDDYLSEVPFAIAIAQTFTCPHCPHNPTQVFPPFASTATTARSEAEIISDELKCYHSRTSFKEDILGIGVSTTKHEGGQHHQLSSPLDLLSYTAFKDGVRQAVYDVDARNQKVTFSHWLPLYICKEHATRAKPLYDQSLKAICADGADYDTDFSDVADRAIYVLPKLLNTMVVKLMSGQTVTSMRALEGYVSFHRILIMFVQDMPLLATRLSKKVSNFIAAPQNRIKKKVPDLGEFLAYLAVTEHTWKDVVTCVIEETLTRNVRWAIEKYPELAKETADPEVDKHRADKTFLASQVSLKLLCFHVVFLQILSEKSLDEIAQEYDSHFGKPSVEMKHRFFEAVKKVKNLSSWSEFFSRVGAPCPAQLEEHLRDCVKRSARLGYHKTGAKKAPRNPKTNPDARANPQAIGRGAGARGGFDTPSRPPRGRGMGPPSARGFGGLLCDFWSRGQTCPHGNKCRFVHK